MGSTREVVEKIAAKQGIADYSYKYGDINNTGDGNFGSFQNFIISGIKSGEPITLNVMAKAPPSNEFLRQATAVTEMFAREIFVYEKILPFYKEIDQKFTAPACYYTRTDVPNELIALQDMRYSGYQLYRKRLHFDLDHVEVSVKALARFHALSTILKLSYPDKYGACVKNCPNFFELDLISVDFKRRISGLLKQTSIEIGGEIGNITQDIVGDENDMFIFHPKIKVICHGDTWKNNILFKYKDVRPVSACFVDYQFVYVGGAASDLIYLIATSTDSVLRRHHFEHLVQTYHDTVVKVLTKLGMPPAKVDDCFSYCDLKKDMKLAGRLCVAIANHSFRNWLGIDSLAEMNSETLAVNSSGNVVEEEIRNKFNTIITDLVMDFRKFELI